MHTHLQIQHVWSKLPFLKTTFSLWMLQHLPLLDLSGVREFLIVKLAPEEWLHRLEGTVELSLVLITKIKNILEQPNVLPVRPAKQGFSQGEIWTYLTSSALRKRSQNFYLAVTRGWSPFKTQTTFCPNLPIWLFAALTWRKRWKRSFTIHLHLLHVPVSNCIFLIIYIPKFWNGLILTVSPAILGVAWICSTLGCSRVSGWIHYKRILRSLCQCAQNATKVKHTTSALLVSQCLLAFLSAFGCTSQWILWLLYPHPRRIPLCYFWSTDSSRWCTLSCFPGCSPQKKWQASRNNMPSEFMAFPKTLCRSTIHCKILGWVLTFRCDTQLIVLLPIQWTGWEDKLTFRDASAYPVQLGWHYCLGGVYPQYTSLISCMIRSELWLPTSDFWQSGPWGGLVMCYWERFAITRSKLTRRTLLQESILLSLVPTTNLC